LAQIFNRIGLLSLLSLSCLFIKHPEQGLSPREIPRVALRKLVRQKSFEFEYSLKRTTPPLLWKFRVRCVLPNLEEIRGERRFGERVEKVWLIGFGDKEYIKKGEVWESHSRGEETRLLDQILRATSLGGFRLKSEDKGSYLFSFSPNVPFLDPTFQKRIEGEFVISKSNLLPKRITAYDTAHTLLWEVKFLAYNRKVEIKIPFKPEFKVIVESEGKVSKGMIDKLKRRFQLYGLGTEVKSKGKREILILLDRVVEMETIEDILKPGVVDIYRIKWVSEEKGKVFHPPDDLSKSFILKEKVISYKDMEGARVGFDELSRPLLIIQLTPSAQERVNKLIRTHYSLMIDNEVVAVFYLDRPIKGGILKIKNLSYAEAKLAMSKILSTPLKRPLRIIAGGKI